MTYSSIRNLWIAFLILHLPFLSFTQVGPCYGNAQAGTFASCGTNIATVNMASPCTTCVYTWQGNPISGTGTPTAQYAFPANPYPAAFTTAQISGSYTDTAGTYCTGTGIWSWEVAIWGTTQMSNPTLINGPYDGDTSKTWIYAREHLTFNTPLASWDYQRSYTVSGGQLQASVINYFPDLWGNYHDTLWIKWNNTANRQISSSGSLTGTYNIGWGLQSPGGCNNYSEAIPPQPLVAAYPIGPDSLCQGDTATYYTTPFTGATYTWTASGGTILSGQGTDVVQVVWNTVPGSITVSRNMSSGTSTNTRPIFPPGSTNINITATDSTICPGSTAILDAGSGTSWIWSTGATTRSITVNDSGYYAVTVSSATCGNNVTGSDTFRVDLHTPVPVDLGPDITYCRDTAQLLTLGPGFVTVNWLGSSMHQPFFNTGTNFPGGPVWVSTVDTNGCSGQDTIVLNSILPPAVNLGPDRTFCDGDSALLSAGNLNANFSWSTGDTTSNIYINTPGNYKVTVTANGCASQDSIVLTEVPFPIVNLGPDSTFCNGDSILLDAGNPGATYTWSNGATTQTAWYTSAGLATVSVVDQGCLTRDTLSLTTLADCVWPGDCDLDGTANNFDVLALGTVIGQSGPLRTNASILWEGQIAQDWANSIPNGPNSKHADCDGNGLVNAADTLAISLNYGLTHNKTNLSNAGASLELIADADSIPAGDTAIFRVRLSDNLGPVDSAYGLAFSLNFDTSLVAGNRMLYADFSNCWLGNTASLLTFSKSLALSPQVDLAIVRTTLHDTLGQGEIGTFAFVTKSDISGKRNLLTKTLHVSLSNARFVDHKLNAMPIMIGQDSVVIFQEELSQTRPITYSLSVFPNPVHHQLQLRMTGSKIAKWEIYDIQGALQGQQQYLKTQSLEISTTSLSNGIYFLNVHDTSGQVHRKKILVRKE